MNIVLFTNEEFSVMVNELLYQDEVLFDMLCCIAEKSLRPTVTRWCQADNSLRGRNYEDDILQEIYLRLMKTTVDYFLLRQGPGCPVNDDPQGFHSWMFKVAMNIKRDFSNRVRQRDFRTDELDDLGDIEWACDDISETDSLETLKCAVQIVLDSDAGVYKSLTWLAQLVFMLQYDVSRIKSNEMIVDAFEHKTLNEMYQMIIDAAESITWLRFDEAQQQKIVEALNVQWDEDTLYGDVKFGILFMKKGGKKSISDWVNRMNNTIRRTMVNGTSEH